MQKRSIKFLIFFILAILIITIKTNNVYGYSLKDAKITYPSSCTYSGKPKTPAVKIKIGNKTFSKNTHYFVTYSNNINAGKAIITIVGNKQARSYWYC